MNLVCISDLHGRFEEVKKIKELAPDIDMLIISGDITHFNSKNVARYILEEILKVTTNILAVPGNCDLREILDVLDEMDINLHGKGRVIDNTGFFGVGGSNFTPFGTPFEMDEDEIARLLHQGYEKVKNSRVRVMVSHPPPYNTSVDRTGSGEHVGSRAVREFVEEFQPDLVLCGHAHESKGADNLGSSIIINPSPLHVGFVKVRLNKDIEHEFIDL